MQGKFRVLVFALTVCGFAQVAVDAVLPPKVSTKAVSQAASKKSVFSKKDCQAFIKQMEVENKIPEGLLMAVAAVESEHNPWAINCAGVSRGFTSYEAAKKFVVELRNQGKVDINIGILQINYGAHKTRFKTAEEVLNPTKNITYAAKYLAQLRKQYGSWQRAVCFYHSPDSRCQEIYLNKVMNALRRAHVHTYNQIMGVSLKHSRAQ